MRKYIVSFLIITLALGITNAVAPTPTDFLDIPFDARGWALGDLGIYGSPSGNALARNPANLAWLYYSIGGTTWTNTFLCCDTIWWKGYKCVMPFWVDLSMNRWVFDNNLLSVSFIKPWSRHFSTGLTFRWLNRPQFDNTDIPDTSDFFLPGEKGISNNSYAIGIVFGGPIVKRVPVAWGFGLNYSNKSLGNEDAVMDLSADAGLIYKGHIPILDTIALGFSATGMLLRISGPAPSIDGFTMFVPANIRLFDFWILPKYIFGDRNDGWEFKWGGGIGLTGHNPLSEISLSAGTEVEIIPHSLGKLNSLSLYWGVPNYYFGNESSRLTTAYPNFFRIGIGAQIFENLRLDIAYDGAGGRRPDNDGTTGLITFSWEPGVKCDEDTDTTVREKFDPPCDTICGFFQKLFGRCNPCSTCPCCSDTNTCDTICVKRQKLHKDYKPYPECLCCRDTIVPYHPCETDYPCNLDSIVQWSGCNPDTIININPHIKNWDCLAKGQRICLCCDICSIWVKVLKPPKGAFFNICEQVPVPCETIWVECGTNCPPLEGTLVLKERGSGRIIESFPVNQTTKIDTYTYDCICCVETPINEENLIVEFHDDMHRRTMEASDSLRYEGLPILSKFCHGEPLPFKEAKDNICGDVALLFIHDRSNSMRERGDIYKIVDKALIQLLDDIDPAQYKRGNLYMGLYAFGQGIKYAPKAPKNCLCNISGSTSCSDSAKNDFAYLVPFGNYNSNIIEIIKDSIQADFSYDTTRGCTPLIATLSSITDNSIFNSVHGSKRKLVVLTTDGYELCEQKPTEWDKSEAKKMTWQKDATMAFETTLKELNKDRINVYVLRSGEEDKNGVLVIDTTADIITADTTFTSTNDTTIYFSYYLEKDKERQLKAAFAPGILFKQIENLKPNCSVEVSNLKRKGNSLHFDVTVTEIAGGHYFIMDAVKYSLSTANTTKSYNGITSMVCDLGAMEIWPYCRINWSDSIEIKGDMQEGDILTVEISGHYCKDIKDKKCVEKKPGTFTGKATLKPEQK